jgi:XRE family transcriptional regulator, aerobic/anaerobic benzoate catabolism transcriptional regulator
MLIGWRKGILHLSDGAVQPGNILRAPVVAAGDEPREGDYLKAIGDRVREARARRGMTRKILARDSGVSERYLAQLEAGRGNISILLLRQIGRALDIPLETLVLDGPVPSVELAHTTEFLRRLRPDEIHRAHELLLQKFGGVDQDARRSRIALIGLRGAGKSTLGALLAERLGVPFIELDRLIEQESGVALSIIFDLYGQSGFRRLERRCLEQVLERHPRFVIATGGSLVSEDSTFERLLSACYTVWLRAAPEDHMQRVIAQGDMRPMAENREAMSDLRRILAGRESLYSKADVAVQTSGHTTNESLEALWNAVVRPANGAGNQRERNSGAKRRASKGR